MRYSLDPSHQPELVSIITTLLRDRSPLSIGSIAVAFDAVSPTRLDLLHPHYRRMCRLLIDLDEWGQLMWLNLLLRYARTMLPKPSIDGAEGRLHSDVDLELLLSSSESLLHSRNPAVGRQEFRWWARFLTSTGNPCSYSCHVLLKLRFKDYSCNPHTLAITR